MEQQSWRRRMKRILLNDTGQMTVFVALIFQVLFVFFAMVINIGLIVHDKINLQNAVDLGAYYAAERQAEILNEIAHVNYQIRQDYKLLAWRYRVLATLGRGAPGDSAAIPPAKSANNVVFGPEDFVDELPSVCVANPMWREAVEASDRAENYCYRRYGDAGRIPPIPRLTVVALMIPFIGLIATEIDRLIENQGASLTSSGPANWEFAAKIMMAYKLSIASRKSVINALRKNLVAEDFFDQAKQSVSLGVATTIKKNLTPSNMASFDDGSFQMINGLASPACAGPNNDGNPTIPEIRTAPTMLYTYPSRIGSNGDYTVDRLPITEIGPLSVMNQAYVNQIKPYVFEPEGAGSSLDSQESLLFSSLGFEKNPWCMAYVGVHAKTRPRKPFAPFGAPITLEARAFAQPFGGRVGPWYSRRWSQNSPISSGDAVDPLTSPRYTGGEAATGESRLPNYSRFPGDRLGLRAKNSQAALRGVLAQYANPATRLSAQFYKFENIIKIPTTGDPLAWDQSSPDVSAPGGTVTGIRRAEATAVMPDLFDATYYSVDSYYSQNYRLLSNGGSRFPAQSINGTQIAVPPDIGGRLGIPGLQDFSIANQIQNAVSSVDQTLKSAGALAHLIFSQDFLLTGWVSNHAQNFNFPAMFGKCEKPASATVMIPGGCASGGRTGYSVRLISRDHLLSPKWLIGGDGEAAGPIKNMPSGDF